MTGAVHGEHVASCKEALACCFVHQFVQELILQDRFGRNSIQRVMEVNCERSERSGHRHRNCCALSFPCRIWDYFSAPQVDRFVAQADRDGDGEVDAKEFLGLMQSMRIGNPHEGPVALQASSCDINPFTTAFFIPHL